MNRIKLEYNIRKKKKEGKREKGKLGIKECNANASMRKETSLIIVSRTHLENGMDNGVKGGE